MRHHWKRCWEEAKTIRNDWAWQDRWWKFPPPCGDDSSAKICIFRPIWCSLCAHNRCNRVSQNHFPIFLNKTSWIFQDQGAGFGHWKKWTLKLPQINVKVFIVHIPWLILFRCPRFSFEKKRGSGIPLYSKKLNHVSTSRCCFYVSYEFFWIYLTQMKILKENFSIYKQWTNGNLKFISQNDKMLHNFRDDNSI